MNLGDRHLDGLDPSGRCSGMGMTVTTTTTLISNPSLLSLIIFGGVCYPAVLRPLKVASQLPDRAAKLGLNAVGLLQAGLEHLLDERPVFWTAGGGEVRLQPVCELLVLRQRGHINQLLDAGDGRLVEGREPARESIGEALDLIVRICRFT